MVAKIHRGSNLLGVLLYNHNKLDKQEATILHTQNIIQPVNGNIGTSEITRSFAPYLFANQKTEKQPNGVKYSFFRKSNYLFFYKVIHYKCTIFLRRTKYIKEFNNISETLPNSLPQSYTLFWFGKENYVLLCICLNPLIATTLCRGVLYLFHF